MMSSPKDLSGSQVENEQHMHANRSPPLLQLSPVANVVPILSSPARQRQTDDRTGQSAARKQCPWADNYPILAQSRATDLVLADSNHKKR